MNGLEKAIKKAGTASNLATLLGIKPMSVSRWKNRYKGIVPHDRVLTGQQKEPTNDQQINHNQRAGD